MIKGNFLPDKVFGLDKIIFLLWLQPLFLGMLILMSISLVITPKINDISSNIAQIKETKAKADAINQKRNYLQSVDQEEIKNNASKLATALLPEKSAYLLVRIVSNIAAEANYAIGEFSISMGKVKNEDSKVENNLGYDKIPVELTLIGPTANYIALTKALERSLPIISIDNFEMKSQGDNSEIKLNVSAYYVRDISDFKLEALSLADLTPSQEETSLLSMLGEYKTMSIKESSGSNEENFIKYERKDPFFTP